MEENNQAIVNETTAKKPKCRHLTVIIILAILFVGSLGFGIFELILNLQKTDKDCKVAADSSQDSSETKTEKKSSGTAKAAPVINDQGGSVAINIEVDYLTTCVNTGASPSSTVT